MKRALLLLFTTILASVAFAQQTPPPPPPKGDPDKEIKVIDPIGASDLEAQKHPDTNKIYTAVEQEPDFPGGMLKFADYVKTHLNYPDLAKQNNVQGRVFLTFIVEKDGSLSDIKVVRGIGSGCDEEAVRLLKKGPKWIPGKQNGYVLRVMYTLPVSFKL